MPSTPVGPGCWCVARCAVSKPGLVLPPPLLGPAGNIKPDRAKSTETIDGVVATIMALDRANRNGGQHNESVYDSRGMLVL